jgi:hypothetical protein
MISLREVEEMLSKVYSEEDATFAFASITVVEGWLLKARVSLALAIRDGKDPGPRTLEVLRATPSELIAKAHKDATVLAEMWKSKGSGAK